MPQYHDPSHDVSINEKTTFIIEQYNEALIRSGLISKKINTPDASDIHTESHFDKRHLIGTTDIRNKGLLARTEEVSVLNEISFELDKSLDKIYEKYINEWQFVLKDVTLGILKKEHLNCKDITSNKINDPNILTYSLISRIVGIVLDEANLLHIDHEKYFTLLNEFISRITNEKSSYNKNKIHNTVSQFLLEQHKHFISFFQQSIICRKEQNALKDTMKEIDHFIHLISMATKKQIIAYWDTKKNSYALEDSTYRSELLGLEHAAKEALANNKLATYTEEKEKNKNALAYFTYINNTHLHAKTIIELYSFLDKINDLSTLISEVSDIINGISWVNFLDDFIELDQLKNYLKAFYEDAAKILKISERTPTLNAKDLSYHALLGCGAISLSHLEVAPVTIRMVTKKSVHKTLYEMVFKNIKYDLRNIYSVQEKIGIELMKFPDASMQEQKQDDAAPKPSTTINNNDTYAKESKTIQGIHAAVSKALTKNDTQEVIKLITTVVGENKTKITFALNQMKDSANCTLLHNMLKNSHYEQSHWLLDQGVSVLIPFNEGTSTALELAARNILRDKKNTGDIKLFLRMCALAKLETQPNPSASKEYKVLSMLNDLAVEKIHGALETYQNIQKQRFNSTIWWLKRLITKFFGQDYTVERAVEVSKIYFSLSKLKQTQNYKLFILELNELLTQSRNSKGSVLHKLIFQALEAITSTVNKNEAEFLQERDEYINTFYCQPRLQAAEINAPKKETEARDIEAKSCTKETSDKNSKSGAALKAKSFFASSSAAANDIPLKKENCSPNYR